MLSKNSRTSTVDVRKNMISFIMPAKNASLYIGQAIGSLCKTDYKDWELIVIDDNSTDGTYDILKQAKEADSRIKVFKNKGSGKVIGLNYGYSLTSGEIIKCIDADDVLDEKFFGYHDIMINYDALCHDCYITTSDLRVIGNYSIDKSILNNNFSFCLKYLKSLPRCAWSFTRSIGDRIFPMPTALPFEDVWFSLMIKKYAKRICYINDKLYYYRQHDNQAFGGILNFNSEVVSFRAKRMLDFIDVIVNEQTELLVQGTNDAAFFDGMRHFYELLTRKKVNLVEIFKSKIPLEFRLKLIIYKKLSFLAPLIIRLKWFLDKMRKGATTPRNNLLVNNQSSFVGQVKSENR